MKTTIIFILTLLVIAPVLMLSSVGCKKSNNNNSTGPITATLNGTAWSSNLLATAIYYTANGQFQLFGVQSKGGDSSKLGLLIITPIILNKQVGPDTPINNFGYFNDVAYVNVKTRQSYDGMPDYGGHSTLMVTAYDSTGHKISGTFSGVLLSLF